MDNDTCSEVDCNQRRYARGFCAKHYGQRYRRGEIGPRPVNPMFHRLTAVDRGNATAVCSICGLTKIRVRHTTGQIQCMTVRRAADKRRPPRHTQSPNSSEQRRRERLKRKFGISVEDYESMLAWQGGVCGICKNPPLQRRLAVDHDHQTGEVRGLLCMSCNISIGHMQNDVAVLSSAIAYLERKRS